MIVNLIAELARKVEESRWHCVVVKAVERALK
jgi:hypothetical protein